MEPNKCRPRRKASLESVSLIKHVASLGRMKRRTTIDLPGPSSGSNTVCPPVSSPIKTPETGSENLGLLPRTALNAALFPSDLGIDFRVGAKVYAKDGYGKWYLARMVDIQSETGYVLVHFEYWSQKYDEWIQVNGGRLRAADSSEKPHPGELLQVGDFVFAKWADKAGTYPAQIIEAFENDKFKLLYYDGFEKVAHRRTLKKMSDAEVNELDLVHFGQLKILPTFPNDLFNPDLAEKYDGKRRSRTSAPETPGGAVTSSVPPALAENSVTRASPKFGPKNGDARLLARVNSSNFGNSTGSKEPGDVIVEKNALKPLPKKSYGVRRNRKIVQSNISGDEKSIDAQSDARTTANVDDSSPTKSVDSADVFLIDVKKSSAVDVDDLPLAKAVGRQNSVQTDSPNSSYDVLVSGSKMIIKSAKSDRKRLKASDQNAVLENGAENCVQSEIGTVTETANLGPLAKNEERKMKKAAMGVAFAVAKLASPKNSIGAQNKTSRDEDLDESLAKIAASENLATLKKRKKRAISLIAENFLAHANQELGEMTKKKLKASPPEISARPSVRVVWDLLAKSQDTWLHCEGGLLFCTPCRLRHQEKTYQRLSRFISGLQISQWSLERINLHVKSPVHKAAIHWMHRLTGRVYPDPPLDLITKGTSERSPSLAEISRESALKKHGLKAEKAYISPDVFVAPKPLEKKWLQTTVTLYRDQWFKKDRDLLYCEACRLYCSDNTSTWKSGVNKDECNVVEHESSTLHKECLQKFYKNQKKTALDHISYLSGLSQLASNSSIFLCPDPFCYMQFKNPQELSVHIKLLHQISTEKAADSEYPVRCVCYSTQRETLMIQCHFCSTMQHGYCFDITDKNSSELYICYVCANPPGVAEKARLENNTLAAFGKFGILPCLLDNSVDCLAGSEASIEQAKRLNQISREISAVKSRLTTAKFRLKMAQRANSSTEKSDFATETIQKEIDCLHSEVEKQMDRMEYLLDDFEANSHMVSSEAEFEKLAKISAVDLASALDDVKLFIADSD